MGRKFIRFLIASLFGLGLLSSCIPQYMRPTRYLAPDLSRPAPDVLILAVSGHCGPPCQAPRDNWDYLGSRGTVDALADVFSGRGYTVQVASYAGNALEHFISHKVQGTQRGFAALLKDFEAIQRSWLSQPRPPRIVLLGHSHGAVWLHHFVRLHPEVKFALQIDLDSICAAWELDQGPNIARSGIDVGQNVKAREACRPNLQVGERHYRPKDLVWPNVAYNLEIQSKRRPQSVGAARGLWFNYLWEVTTNVRPDGSTTGIEHFISIREDHSAVSLPHSEAMLWVYARTAELMKQWR